MSIELNISEKKAIMELFHRYTLVDRVKERDGKIRLKYMRQARIWISDAKFPDNLPEAESKIHKELIQRKVLKAHSIMGYEIRIQEAYVNKIYKLADRQEYELLESLLGVWLE